MPIINHINIETDLGCVPFDDTAGAANAALINAALADVGVGSYDGIYIPGKSFAISETLIIPTRAGGSIFGNGHMYNLAESHVGLSLGACSRLLWTGNDSSPLLEYRGFAWRILGVTLMGYWRPNEVGPPPAYRCSTGLRVSKQGASFPTGNLLADMMFIGFETAVHCDHAPNNDHCDTMHWRHFGIDDVGIGYKSTNSQSVCHTFDYVWTAGLQGTPLEALFDFQKGGDLRVNSLALVDPTTVLRVNEIDVNTCSFEIEGIKLDNNAFRLGLPDLKLFEMQKLQDVPCRVRMSGHVGNAYQVGEPLVITEGNSYDVRLDFFGLDASTAKAYPAIGVRADDRVLSETPPSTNLRFWLSATDRAAMLLGGSPAPDGGEVDTVNDKSTANNDVLQATSVNRPHLVADSIHHRPALQFDGADIMAKSSATGLSNTTLTNGLTVVAIVRENNHNPTADNVIVAVDNWSSQRAWSLQIDQDGYAVMTANLATVGVQPFKSSGKLRIRQQSLIIARYNSANGEWLIEVNGVPTPNDVGVGQSIVSSTAALTVGGRLIGGSTNGYNFGGYIGDVAVYDNALSDGTLDWWREYARAKYGCPVAL